MQIKSKYKIARRLGPEIFDKTQTQKFAVRQSQRRDATKKKPRPRSDFGSQLIEKQKARYTYGINERQFSKYVQGALSQKNTKADAKLHEKLETRLDNVAYRLGLAPSRQAARQMVSHGHLLVNDVRVTIPSYNVKVGDVIKIREGSLKKPLFINLAEKIKDHSSPAWLSFDYIKGQGKIEGKPVFNKTELTFDLGAILEFYKR